MALDMVNIAQEIFTAAKRLQQSGDNEIKRCKSSSNTCR